jgi:hypothetical protein
MPTLDEIRSQLLGLQPAVDEQIERFREHPRLPHMPDDPLGCIIGELRRLSLAALAAGAPLHERQAVARTAAREAEVLSRLANQADLAWREDRDAPWPVSDLSGLAHSIAQLEEELGERPTQVSRMASLPIADRERLIQRVTRDLVRTMRAVPAPGVDPLTRRDWLLLGLLALAFCVVFAGVVILSGRVWKLRRSEGVHVTRSHVPALRVDHEDPWLPARVVADRRAEGIGCIFDQSGETVVEPPFGHDPTLATDGQNGYGWCDGTHPNRSRSRPARGLDASAIVTTSGAGVRARPRPLIVVIVIVMLGSRSAEQRPAGDQAQPEKAEGDEPRERDEDGRYHRLMPPRVRCPPVHRPRRGRWPGRRFRDQSHG